MSGFLGFAADLQSPWWHISAIAFGIGAGLTIDEFALWLYLRDVYWAREGRLSVDAAVLATVFAVLVVLGTKPFGLDDPGSVLATVLLFLEAVVLSALAFLKGRFLIGVVALFIPFWGLVAAVRLARPSSPWARWRYRGPRADKLARAERRFRTDRRAAELGDRLVTLTTGLSQPEPTGGRAARRARLSPVPAVSARRRRARPRGPRGGRRAPGRARSRRAPARRATSARCPW